MRTTTLATALAATLLLAACQHAPKLVQLPVTQTVVAEVGSDAHDNLNAVLWVQASAEYDAAALSVYNAAAARLDDALADPAWDALAPALRSNPDALPSLPPAVVLDLDETVLDNAPYQARMVTDGTSFEDDTWAAWVEERAAGAVPGVADFTRTALARGIAIVYLSNRTHAMEAATLDNLRTLGIPAGEGVVYLGKGAPGCEQAGSDKDCRRRLVAERFRVLMLFGDQLGDFLEPAGETPVARQAVVDGHAGWFGERWWMLPNPTYGDWEPALYERDWSLSPEARRAAKRHALDTTAP